MRAFKPFPSAKICICPRIITITATYSAISLKKGHLKTSDSKRIVRINQESVFRYMSNYNSRG